MLFRPAPPHTNKQNTTTSSATAPPTPLQALADKLKGMSSELLLGTTRHGDLHLLVNTSGAVRGCGCCVVRCINIA